MFIPTTTMSAPHVKTMSAASGSPYIYKIRAEIVWHFVKLMLEETDSYLQIYLTKNKYLRETVKSIRIPVIGQR